MAKPAFSAGDRYEMTGNFCASFASGDIVTITEDGKVPYYSATDQYGRTKHCFGHDFALKLVSRANGTRSWDVNALFNLNKEQEGDTTMSNAIENPRNAIKNLKLDADTIILRQANLEGSDGTVTGYGRDIIMDLLWTERRADVAKGLREAEAAEKASTAPVTE